MIQTQDTFRQDARNCSVVCFKARIYALGHKVLKFHSGSNSTNALPHKLQWLRQGLSRPCCVVRSSHLSADLFKLKGAILFHPCRLDVWCWSPVHPQCIRHLSSRGNDTNKAQMCPYGLLFMLKGNPSGLLEETKSGVARNVFQTLDLNSKPLTNIFCLSLRY
jgi:hypothetical protein